MVHWVVNIKEKMLVKPLSSVFYTERSKLILDFHPNKIAIVTPTLNTWLLVNHI